MAAVQLGSWQARTGGWLCKSLKTSTGLDGEDKRQQISEQHALDVQSPTTIVQVEQEQGKGG